MPASYQQAERDLEVIDQSKSQLRAATLYGGADQILTGWGVAWLIGYVVTWWMDQRGIRDWRVFLAWNPCVIFGTYMTWRAMSAYPIQMQAGWRVGAMWGLLFAFLYLWLAILWPLNPYQLFTFFSTVIMLAWVILGLILNNWLWIVLGCAIGFLIGGGYLLIGPTPTLWLWHAGFGGGSMLLAAAILWQKGKSRGGA